MKRVVINVYEFDELAQPIKEKLFEQVRDSLVDGNFTTFSENVDEMLKERYGIDGRVCYSLSYSQGDGLHFDTENLLTAQVIELVKKRITPRASELLDELLESSFNFGYKTKSSVNRYEYASKFDVKERDKDEYLLAIEGLNDDDKAYFKHIAYKEVDDAVRTVYLEICKELEDIGYKSYDVDDDQVYGFLTGAYYYSDGRFHSEKENYTLTTLKVPHCFSV